MSERAEGGHGKIFIGGAPEAPESTYCGFGSFGPFQPIRPLESPAPYPSPHGIELVEIPDRRDPEREALRTLLLCGSLMALALRSYGDRDDFDLAEAWERKLDQFRKEAKP